MCGTVIIFDYDSNRIRQEIKHNGGVIRMMWHPNNFILVTGCLDGCVYVWDARTGRNLYKLSGHTDLLLDMDIYIQDKMLYIASVSDDKTCQIFRVRVYICLQQTQYVDLGAVPNYTITHPTHSNSVHVAKSVFVHISSVLLELRDVLQNILHIHLHRTCPSQLLSAR